MSLTLSRVCLYTAFRWKNVCRIINKLSEQVEPVPALISIKSYHLPPMLTFWSLLIDVRLTSPYKVQAASGGPLKAGLGPDLEPRRTAQKNCCYYYYDYHYTIFRYISVKYQKQCVKWVTACVVQTFYITYWLRKYSPLSKNYFKSGIVGRPWSASHRRQV